MTTDEMKYVILHDPKRSCDVPILFPAFYDHKDIADRFPGWRVVSAGRVDVCAGTERLKAWGGSMTLGADSLESDRDAIRAMLDSDFRCDVRSKGTR